MGVERAISIAMSGMAANSRSVATIANNIANVNTKGFVAGQPVTTSVVSPAQRGSASTIGGVKFHVKPSVTFSATSLEMTSVDLVGEFSRLAQARTAYGFGADLVRTGSEMIREAFTDEA